MPTIPQLRELGRTHNIHLPSKYKKAQLEQTLRDAGIDIPISTKGARQQHGLAFEQYIIQKYHMTPSPSALINGMPTITPTQSKLNIEPITWVVKLN